MFGTLIKFVALSRHAQLAGGAVNEFYTEIVFKMLYRFTDGGAVQLQNISGFGEATQFNNLDKNSHIFNHIGTHISP